MYKVSCAQYHTFYQHKCKTFSLEIHPRTLIHTILSIRWKINRLFCNYATGEISPRVWLSCSSVELPLSSEGAGGPSKSLWIPVSYEFSFELSIIFRVFSFVLDCVYYESIWNFSIGLYLAEGAGLQWFEPHAYMAHAYTGIIAVSTPGVTGSGALSKWNKAVGHSAVQRKAVGTAGA